MGSLTSPKSARHQVSGTWRADLPTHRPTPLLRDNHRPVELPSCVTPSACLLPDRSVIPLGPKAPAEDSASRFQHGRPYTGTGISTRCPSTTPVGLALGPDLPWADQLDPGTLGQSAQEFPTPVSLLMSAFSLVQRPRLGSPAASRAARRSPTHPLTGMPQLRRYA